MDKFKELDQFYTRQDVAESCWQKLQEILSEYNIDDSEYTYLEPSAGAGSFFKLMPEDRRLGLDLEPRHPEVKQQDFLKWYAEYEGQKLIACGNPPFNSKDKGGGALAAHFVNKCMDYCDVVAMIIPPGVARGNVYKLNYRFKKIYEEELHPSSFEFPDGKLKRVHCRFVIWSKINIDKINTENVVPMANEYVDFYLYDSRTVNKNKWEWYKENGHIFLSRVDFKKQFRVSESPKYVEERHGYGIVIKKNVEEIKKLLLETDWLSYADVSHMGAYIITHKIIHKVITDAGYVDRSLEDFIEVKKTANDWLDIFRWNLKGADAKPTARQAEKLLQYEDSYDILLPIDAYPNHLKATENWDDIQMKYSTYFIKIKKDVKEIKKLLYDTDWTKIANFKMTNSYYIKEDHIHKVLTDAGYVDSNLEEFIG